MNRLWDGLSAWQDGWIIVWWNCISTSCVHRNKIKLFELAAVIFEDFENAWEQDKECKKKSSDDYSDQAQNTFWHDTKHERVKDWKENTRRCCQVRRMKWQMKKNALILQDTGRLSIFGTLETPLYTASILISDPIGTFCNTPKEQGICIQVPQLPASAIILQFEHWHRCERWAFQCREDGENSEKPSGQTT